MEAAQGWLELGNPIQKAYETLLPTGTKFGANCLVHHYWARYACQAGRLNEARFRLLCANQLGGVKKMALDELHLELLWKFMDGL